MMRKPKWVTFAKKSSSKPEQLPNIIGKCECGAGGKILKVFKVRRSKFTQCTECGRKVDL